MSEYKPIIGFGLLLALLMAVLKFVQYRFLVLGHSFELYSGIIAVFFLGLGIWMGRARKKPDIKNTAFAHEVSPEKVIQRLGISEREYEILRLIEKGNTNQEIAEQLFISTNTVKTHVSNLFSKMGVNRRTQALKKAKEEGLI